VFAFVLVSFFAALGQGQYILEKNGLEVTLVDLKCNLFAVLAVEV
jgi:hypothetical protein